MSSLHDVLSLALNLRSHSSKDESGFFVSRWCLGLYNLQFNVPTQVMALLLLAYFLEYFYCVAIFSFQVSLRSPEQGRQIAARCTDSLAPCWAYGRPRVAFVLLDLEVRHEIWWSASHEQYARHAECCGRRDERLCRQRLRLVKWVEGVLHSKRGLTRGFMTLNAKATGFTTEDSRCYFFIGCNAEVVFIL